jgi:hypothetical protein
LPGNANQQSSSFSDYAQAWYGFPEATLQESVHLSFVNASSNSLEGSLSGYAMAYGPHLAVPSPARRRCCSPASGCSARRRAGAGDPERARALVIEDARRRAAGSPRR